MIKIKDLTSHGDMCGGVTYYGDCTLEGKTVKEVLEEIKEYTSNPRNTAFAKIGEFGNSDEGFGCAWGIYINELEYISSWNSSWRKPYQGEFDDCEVESVRVRGGWYCAYDFYITVKVGE